jgi:DtxR family Mn-dependent transcriptional regulator
MKFSMKTADTAGLSGETQKFTAAMEDYLKTIAVLEQENRVARVSDISRRMNVRKASVVSAVSFLQKSLMLTHEKYGFITLTETGRLAAAVLKKKYDALYSFFTNDLNIAPEQAVVEVCAAEHALSGETVAKIKALAKTARKASPPEKQKANMSKKKRR